MRVQILRLAVALIPSCSRASPGQRPVEGAQRRRLWKLQGFLQTQPHLPGEPGTPGTAAHRAARIQVRGHPQSSDFQAHLVFMN